MNITINEREHAMILAGLRMLANRIHVGGVDSGHAAILTDDGSLVMPTSEDVHCLADALNCGERDVPPHRVEAQWLARQIDETCQQGLNSEDPMHWQAALNDILQVVRS